MTQGRRVPAVTPRKRNEQSPQLFRKRSTATHRSWVRPRWRWEEPVSSASSPLFDTPRPTVRARNGHDASRGNKAKGTSISTRTIRPSGSVTRDRGRGGHWLGIKLLVGSQFRGPRLLPPPSCERDTRSRCRAAPLEAPTAATAQGAHQFRRRRRLHPGLPASPPKGRGALQLTERARRPHPPVPRPPVATSPAFVKRESA